MVWLIYSTIELVVILDTLHLPVQSIALCFLEESHLIFIRSIMLSSSYMHNMYLRAQLDCTINI